MEGALILKRFNARAGTPALPDQMTSGHRAAHG